MADTDRDRSQPGTGETRDVEHDRVRSSNDSDQAAEREGIESDHNRGYDEAVRGSESSGEEMFEDVDPDSARSDVDRDDTIDEI
jgi:hypothetical protein